MGDGGLSVRSGYPDEPEPPLRIAEEVGAAEGVGFVGVRHKNLTLAEIKAATLKVMYGADNVTDLDGVITVEHNGNKDEAWSIVLELVLKNGRRWRKVVPAAKSSELDDIKLAVSEIAGRQITFKYLVDSNGNTCYDYIESTETNNA